MVEILTTAPFNAIITYYTNQQLLVSFIYFIKSSGYINIQISNNFLNQINGICPGQGSNITIISKGVLEKLTKRSRNSCLGCFHYQEQWIFFYGFQFHTHPGKTDITYTFVSRLRKNKAILNFEIYQEQKYYTECSYTCLSNKSIGISSVQLETTYDMLKNNHFISIYNSILCEKLYL